MRTSDVRVWAVRRNRSSKRAAWTARWVVAGRSRSKTFATKALAEGYRSDLMQAVRRGELFEVGSGLPESMRDPVQAVTCLEFFQQYLDMKWPHAAAKSRDSLTDALATAAIGLVGDRPNPPEVQVLRLGLRQWALPPPTRGARPPAEVRAALRWLVRASLPLSALSDPRTTRQALDSLTVRLDGRAAAAETVRRKRAVLYNVLKYAVELGELPSHPIDRVAWTRPKVADAVDHRVVVNPAQARQLLAAVTYVGSVGRARGERLMAFFACLYYAGLRPAEAVALRRSDCTLPSRGWGRLTLAQTRPTSAKRWTDGGEVHDRRGLKHRADRSVRTVPIPPELVRLLREHVRRFGTADDGRLFRSERGNVVSSSAYWRVWSEARVLGLSPEQQVSPLARRPYDLRQAAISPWLNSGVPATEVARRAGHTVDVLLKVYASCLDGQEATVNERIERGLTSP